MGDYKVEHISNSGVITDISEFVHSIDYVRSYSDGRISTASLTLQASFGKFMTNNNGGTTPIIQNFDRMRLTGIAESNQYQHIFVVINNLAQVTNQSEYLLPLTLEGRERALAEIPFSGYFDALNHFEMVERILETYGISRVFPLQPIIDSFDDGNNNTNLLPKYNPNIWDYQYIDNCLDAIIAVKRLADQSVAAGGAGDRFAIIYEDSSIDPLIKMTIRIISQGTNNLVANRPIIRSNEISNPITHIPRVIQPLTGTFVIARGKPGSGGVPVEGDTYRSRLEFYQRIEARQSWSSTITYAIDALTSFDGQVYEALNENINSQPPNANWSTLDAGDYIGAIQYSPFTIDKAALYKNECTNPQLAFSSEIEDSPKMLDCNIVINDVETQRDWVYIRQITDNVNSWSSDEKKYLFKETDLYEGFRILVDVSNLGTASGAFSSSLNAFGTGAGNDPNGLPYENNQAVFINGVWYVIREHQSFDQTLVRFEGLFEFNIDFAQGSRFPASALDNSNRRFRSSTSGTPNQWEKLGGQFLANDCLHSPTSITNVTGLINPVAQPGGGDYTDDSAVQIVYEYGNKDDMPEWLSALEKIVGIAASNLDFVSQLAIGATQALYNLFLTPFYRNVGWWITFSAPFPVSTFNGITEQLGELYGAGQSFSVNTLNQHSTFDAFNQSATFTGKGGWAEDDSNTLMEITGVSFLFNLDIQNNGVTIPFTGDIPCSYWAIDDNGTIWKSKKKYRLLKDTQRMTFEFGDFSPVYRARSPFGISNIVTNLLTPELEIRERLFPNRIRLQGFMLEAPYDEHGRYIPDIWETVIKPTIFTMFDPTTVTVNLKFVGIIDYFQWVKTPIALSQQTGATRAIFPEIKDYPNISNIQQLQRAADADIDVETFPYEQYEITRDNKADLSLQDTVYLFEKYMIPQAEAPAPTGADAWSSIVTYAVDDLVESVSITYICTQVNTNEIPPNTDFWDVLEDPVQHTRELTVGEINWSVTNSKDVLFTHTLIRRIPKVT